MSLNEELRLDCLVHEERLRVWVDLAEAALKEEDALRCVHDLLFWSKSELTRRRRYLGRPDRTELERRAEALLRALAERLGEK